MRPIHSPFAYFQKQYDKFINIRLLENSFEDFDKNFIGIQTKIIYEEAKEALTKKETPYVMRSFHEDLLHVRYFLLVNYKQ